MVMTDPIADMLTTIRNGQQVRLIEVSTPASKIKKGVLSVLKDEGYIKDFSEVEVRKNIKRLKIQLKYFDNQPVIKKIKRISKPGLRNYKAVDALPRVQNGLGMLILTTSAGILADHEARKRNVSGEILCEVY